MLMCGRCQSRKKLSWQHDIWDKIHITYGVEKMGDLVNGLENDWGVNSLVYHNPNRGMEIRWRVETDKMVVDGDIFWYKTFIVYQ